MKYYIASISVLQNNTLYSFCRHLRTSKPHKPDDIYQFVKKSLKTEFPDTNVINIVIFETVEKNFDKEYSVYSL